MNAGDTEWQTGVQDGEAHSSAFAKVLIVEIAPVVRYG